MTTSIISILETIKSINFEMVELEYYLLDCVDEETPKDEFTREWDKYTRLECELESLETEYNRIQRLISRATCNDAIALVWVWSHAYELIRGNILSPEDWDTISWLYCTNIDRTVCTIEVEERKEA